MVRAVLQDAGHTLVAGIAEMEGTGTSRLQALRTIFQAQAQEILHRAQVGQLAIGKELMDNPMAIGADAPSHLQTPLEILALPRLGLGW